MYSHIDIYTHIHTSTDIHTQSHTYTNCHRRSMAGYHDLKWGNVESIVSIWPIHIIYEQTSRLIWVIRMSVECQKKQNSVIGDQQSRSRKATWLGLNIKAWMDQPLLIKKSLMILGIWLVWLACYIHNDCCDEKKKKKTPNVISLSPGLLFWFGLIWNWAKVLLVWV